MFVPKTKAKAKAYAAMGISAALVLGLPSVSSASLLQNGSSGDGVEDLQSKLKELGYFKHDKITGYYGSITESAVREFQKSKGIAQDGIVGNTTLSHLFPKEEAKESQLTDSNLRLGSRGDDVTYLQKILKGKGYMDGSVDGIFGAITLGGVELFQQKNGLVVDGIVGPKTWQVLRSEEASSSRGSASTSNSLRLDDRGEVVSVFQKRLKELGYSVGAVDGIFGQRTLEALKQFQRETGLVVDGIAGTKTFAMLENPVKIKDDSNQAPPKTEEPKETVTETPSETVTDNNEVSTDSSTCVMMEWSEVNKLWAIGTKATMVDFDTGTRIALVRSGGYNHADCETATAEDTRLLKSLYGGSFSWNRRAVIIEINGQRIAASTAGMPHAGRDDMPNRAMVSDRSGGYGYGQNLDAIKGNDMDGVIDIHFYGSKTHGTNKVDSQHQAQVMRAAGK